MNSFLSKSFAAATVVALATMSAAAFAAQGSSSPYTDAIGDIDPGIATAGGTLDITGMEVSNTATDLNFKLTVNGNISTTDWGKFMIGIATQKTDGTLTGNGWGRPINLSYDNDPFAAQIVGMNHWIGSWVDGGGGSQFWTYDTGSSAWVGGAALPAFSLSAGTTSEVNYSVPLATMNLIPGNVIYFDAYSSGGGNGDSAIDSLANPNVSVTNWGDTYTSYATGAGGPGLNAYTITAVPEPSSIAVVGLAGAAIAGHLMRRRRSA
jgi:hypothetical protein